MANTIRIKRRAAGGSVGAPSSLWAGELAYNEQDSTLYIGVGTGGAGGTATSIPAIAGPGAFAPLSSPTLTGTPAAPTAAADTNTTQIATTAFVVGQASSSNPVMDGSVTIGTSLKYARADHVHPSDTSKADLSSPTFSGTPAAPTAAADTNTTQLATTAFVVGQASTSNPAALGSVGYGSSLKYARADHVHAMPVLSALGTPTADVAMGTYKITGLGDPASAQDAATKNYVDSVAQGLDAKPSVRAATTASITLSGTQSIDGVSVIATDRVLVKNQSSASANGIYVVAAGAWSRATDMDAWAEVPNAFVFVEEGSTLADTGWVCTANAGGTLGSTDINWAQFSSAGAYSAGNGLDLSGNTFSVKANGTTIDVSSSGVKVSDTYAGNSSLVTLGTVTTGTWNGTTIDVGHGGTGATTFTSNGIIYGNSTSALQVTAAGTWDGTNSVGQLLSVNSSGVPTWTNTIDGGAF